MTLTLVPLLRLDLKPSTVLRFTLVSWHILRVSFEAYVSNEQPLVEKTKM